MPKLRLFPLAALLAGCATATPIASGPIGELPRTYDARPTSAAITPADLMSRLYPFADDSMMGREAGTRGTPSRFPDREKPSPGGFPPDVDRGTVPN